MGIAAAVVGIQRSIEDLDRIANSEEGETELARATSHALRQICIALDTLNIRLEGLEENQK